MFEIYFDGESFCTYKYAVARAILRGALLCADTVKIFWDGQEISLEAFNQMPVFC